MRAGPGRRFGAVGRLAGEAGLLGAATAFTAAATAIALIVNARALGPDGFGVLAVVQSYVALIATVATLESWQVMVRLGARYERQLPGIAAWGLALDALVALAATLCALLLVLALGAAFGISEAHRELALIYSLSLLAGVAGTPKGVLRLRRRFDVLAAQQVLSGLAVVVAALALSALKAPLKAYIVTYACLGAAANLGLLLVYLHMRGRLLGPRPAAPLSRRGRAILPRVAATAAGTSLLATLKNTRRHALILLSAAVLDATGAGLFAIASRLSNILFRASLTLNQVIFPEVLRRSSARQRIAVSAFVRASLLLAGLALAGAAAGYALREPLVALAAGAAYRGAADMFGLLLAAEFVLLAALHADPVVQSLAGTRPLIAIWLAVGLPGLGLAALAGTMAGGAGIAAANLVASLVLYALLIGAAVVLLRRAGEPKATAPSPRG